MSRDTQLDDQQRRNLLKAMGGIPVIGVTAGCTGENNQGDGGDGGDGSAGDGGDGGSSEPTEAPESGEPVELLFEAPQYKNYPNEMRWIMRQWADNLGISFELSTRAWETWLGDIFSAPHVYENIAYTGFGASPDRIDPSYFLSLFTQDSNQNIPAYENDEYDELYRQQLGSYEFEERNQHIIQMQEMLHEDRPTLVYLRPRAEIPVNTELWDVEPTYFLGFSMKTTISLLDAVPKTDQTTLVMGATGGYDAPNPLASDSITPPYTFQLVYDTPRRVGKEGEFQNWALSEYETVDETTLDLTLRDDLTFHDGEEVTAEDLTFSMQFFRDYTFPKFDPYSNLIDSAETQTDLTTRVTLTQPAAQFATSGLSFLYVLPKHIWESVPDQVESPRNWNIPDDQRIGSGPFMPTEVTSDRIVMEKNPDYFYDVAWDRFIWINRGNYETLIADFRNGDVHCMQSSAPTDIAYRIRDEASGVELTDAPGLLCPMISFDTQEEPTNDKAFRKALVQAMDYEQFNETFYAGAGDIQDGTMIHQQLKFGTTELTNLTDIFDPEAARATLEDAGYSWDDDGQLLMK